MVIDNHESDFWKEVRINPKIEYEINYWSEKFNVSPQRIIEAMADTKSDKLIAIVEFLKKMKFH